MKLTPDGALHGGLELAVATCLLFAEVLKELACHGCCCCCLGGDACTAGKLWACSCCEPCDLDRGCDVNAAAVLEDRPGGRNSTYRLASAVHLLQGGPFKLPLLAKRGNAHPNTPSTLAEAFCLRAACRTSHSRPQGLSRPSVGTHSLPIGLQVTPPRVRALAQDWQQQRRHTSDSSDAAQADIANPRAVQSLHGAGTQRTGVPGPRHQPPRPGYQPRLPGAGPRQVSRCCGYYIGMRCILLKVVRESCNAWLRLPRMPCRTSNPRVVASAAKQKRQAVPACSFLACRSQAAFAPSCRVKGDPFVEIEYDNKQVRGAAAVEQQQRAAVARQHSAVGAKPSSCRACSSTAP